MDFVVVTKSNMLFNHDWWTMIMVFVCLWDKLFIIDTAKFMSPFSSIIYKSFDAISYQFEFIKVCLLFKTRGVVYLFCLCVIGAGIWDSMYCVLWYVITHARLNFKCGLAKVSLKLWHVWVGSYPMFWGCNTTQHDNTTLHTTPHHNTTQHTGAGDRSLSEPVVSDAMWRRQFTMSLKINKLHLI